jgi:hypothetical protein
MVGKPKVVEVSKLNSSAPPPPVKISAPPLPQILSMPLPATNTSVADVPITTGTFLTFTFKVTVLNRKPLSVALITISLVGSSAALNPTFPKMVPDKGLIDKPVSESRLVKEYLNLSPGLTSENVPTGNE